MEVHHHGHVQHSHKWKDYTYQFLMLFLAVFCGVLAEYQLDHRIEKEREEEYMVSMTDDLKQDVINIDIDIRNRTEKIQNADSLTALLLNDNYQNNSGMIYYLARKFSVVGYVFHMTDGTLMELKNSGGLRLVKKQKVVDGLQHYFNLYQKSEDVQLFARESLVEYRDVMIQLFDFKVFNEMINNFPRIAPPKGNPALLSTDSNRINELLMRVQLVKTAEIVSITHLKELKEVAIKMQESIKKEYKLE